MVILYVKPLSTPFHKNVKKKERRYVCFDGDVDALWIENMNSVMDDNKLLTLANGERIRLENYCALLFEVCSTQLACRLGNQTIICFLIRLEISFMRRQRQCHVLEWYMLIQKIWDMNHIGRDGF